MKLRSILLGIGVLLGSYGYALAGEVTVAVAANLQYTFEDLKVAFEKQTGIHLKGIIGSSGKFTAQIENGAPFDVFLSADMDYPKALKKEGLAYNDPKIYAYGTLVLWTLKEKDLSQGIELLKDSSIRKIAIASPKTAPYGRQAINAIKHFNLYPAIAHKLVYGESIAQTNQFITTKSVDVGITAKSVVLANNMKNQGRWIELDKNSYQPIAQGAIILKHAQKNNLEEAQKFFEFIFSKEAQDIFEKYGYIRP